MAKLFLLLCMHVYMFVYILSVHAEEQPPSVGQSFLSRIVSAITPAKLTRITATPTTSVLPVSQGAERRELAGPSSVSGSATHSIQGSNKAGSAASDGTHSKEKGQAPMFKTPSRHGRGVTSKLKFDSTTEMFELQEFSAIRRSSSKTSVTSSGSDYVDFQAPSTHHSPSPSSSSSVKTNSAASPPCRTDTSSLRRSVRIARRRSFKQTTFPSLSVLPLVCCGLSIICCICILHAFLKKSTVICAIHSQQSRDTCALYC